MVTGFFCQRFLGGVRGVVSSVYFFPEEVYKALHGLFARQSKVLGLMRVLVWVVWAVGL